MDVLGSDLWAAAFANGFWVFVGIVAGAIIQYALGRLQGRSQAGNAFQVLRAEIELNLDAVEVFQRRVRYLRDRIMAGQVSEDDLFVSASNFDYSVVSPLVNLGYFHMLLGPDYVKKYFRFMQFFNNSSAQQMNSDLRLKHAEGKSIDLLDMLLGISENLSQGLAEIHAAKLDWWGLRLKPVKRIPKKA